MANSKIYLGSTNIESMYNGASDISIYLGDEKLYPLGFQGKFMAEYSDSTSYSADCDSSTELTTATTRAHSTPYSAMTDAVIGDCVTTLGVDLFRDCSALTKVNSSVNGLFNIPSGITSIGDNAFRSCVTATTINLPNSVTTIGTSAFRFCINLRDITLPSGLTTINSDMFDSCRSLTGVTIPNTITSIGNSAFTKCYSLETIEIPSSVTHIGVYVFQNCSGLTSVTIGSGVTSIGGGTFTKCTSLTSIDIPNSVRNIAYDAFANCSGLTSVTIGSGVTSIGGGTFKGCSNLTSITVEATKPPTLGDGYVFDNTNDCPIYVPCESLEAYKSANRWSQYADRIQCKFEGKWKATYSGGETYELDCDGNTTLTLSETHPSGYQPSAMTEAIIGDCVTEIGGSNFSNCKSLTSVTIPDSVTSIGSGSFEGCGSLTSIDIPSGVTSIGVGVFNGCSGLTDIVIPDGVTSIEDWTFTLCYSLTSINIPSGVTSIGYNAFSYCRSLTSTDIPSGVTSIGAYAFRGSTGLTSVTINAVTPPTLGEYAFDRIQGDHSGCPIYVPSASLTAYQTASVWSDYASRIQAIPNS